VREGLKPFGSEPHFETILLKLQSAAKGRSLQMTNRKVWRYPEAFRVRALDQFNRCENVELLAKELGIPRQTLYRWHEQSERAELEGEPVAAKSRESRLRKEISNLKRLVAEKVVEVDFFKGALQKIEARRRGSSGSGEPASTTTSGT
jgi:transposase